jgi:hypothetical protein
MLLTPAGTVQGEVLFVVSVTVVWAHAPGASPSSNSNASLEQMTDEEGWVNLFINPISYQRAFYRDSWLLWRF